MALKSDTLTKLTAALDDVSKDIANFQATYLAANKRYWQGIRTPTLATKEGADASIETNKKPTDQLQDWSGVLKSLVQPCALEVYTHDGPLGLGYTLFAFSIAEDNSLWSKAMGFGEHSFTFDWIEQVFDDLDKISITKKAA